MGEEGGWRQLAVGDGAYRRGHDGEALGGTEGGVKVACWSEVIHSPCNPYEDLSFFLFCFIFLVFCLFY